MEHVAGNGGRLGCAWWFGAGGERYQGSHGYRVRVRGSHEGELGLGLGLGLGLRLGLEGIIP